MTQTNESPSPPSLSIPASFPPENSGQNPTPSIQEKTNESQGQVPSSRLHEAAR
ncbi:hypothetical protein DL98DRAFT_515298 [Cadophora sp. DSE1049]|nr:hypothetical protein DL98DRAFT_515298 [Cadophora sp. DSE1049]